MKSMKLIFLFLLIIAISAKDLSPKEKAINYADTSSSNDICLVIKIDTNEYKKYIKILNCINFEEVFCQSINMPNGNNLDSLFMGYKEMKLIKLYFEKNNTICGKPITFFKKRYGEFIKVYDSLFVTEADKYPCYSIIENNNGILFDFLCGGLCGGGKYYKIEYSLNGSKLIATGTFGVH